MFLQLQNFDFKTPVRKWTLQERQQFGLRQYNIETHMAAFAVPDYGHLNPNNNV